MTKLFFFSKNEKLERQKKLDGIFYCPKKKVKAKGSENGGLVPNRGDSGVYRDTDCDKYISHSSLAGEAMRSLAVIPPGAKEMCLCVGGGGVFARAKK